MEYVIMFACMIGASYTCFNAGVKNGAEGMFEYLYDKGQKSNGRSTITLSKQGDSNGYKENI